MKTWRLVSGVLSIVLFVVVTFQSCAAGVVNSIESNKQVSGSAGFLVAVMMLVGGIVSIATKNKEKGGCIATLILYGIGAVIGFVLAGNFQDLYIWAGWCLLCAVLSVPALKSKPEENVHEKDN